MNPLLADPAEFASLLQRFFAERLLQQRNASPRTVEAYRDTFRLLLNYAERERGKAPAKLALSDFDAALILDFLAHLETEPWRSSELTRFCSPKLTHGAGLAREETSRRVDRDRFRWRLVARSDGALVRRRLFVRVRPGPQSRRPLPGTDPPRISWTD